MEPTVFGLVAVAALIATRYYYKGIITKRDEEIRHLTLKVRARDANIEYAHKCNSVLEKENKQLCDERHKLIAERILLRNEIEDAAHEWAQYVEVDTAPRDLPTHMLRAFDAIVGEIGA